MSLTYKNIFRTKVIIYNKNIVFFFIFCSYKKKISFICFKYLKMSYIYYYLIFEIVIAFNGNKTTYEILYCLKLAKNFRI